MLLVFMHVILVIIKVQKRQQFTFPPPSGVGGTNIAHTKLHPYGVQVQTIINFLDRHAHFLSHRVMTEPQLHINFLKQVV